MNKDFYKILGVAENASGEDIKKAYRQLAHQYHPDKQGGDEQKFKEINGAYQTLSDNSKRQQYDMLRKYGATGFGRGSSPRGDAGWGGSSFDFGFGPGADSLEDILSQFFGGMGYAATGTRSRGFGWMPKKTVQFSHHGPKGANIIIQVENITEVTPKMKREVEEFVQKFFKEVK